MILQHPFGIFLSSESDESDADAFGLDARPLFLDFSGEVLLFLFVKSQGVGGVGTTIGIATSA